MTQLPWMKFGYSPDVQKLSAYLVHSTAMNVASSLSRMEEARVRLSQSQSRVVQSLKVITRSEGLERELRRVIYF
jgi:hypothetical protein